MLESLFDRLSECACLCSSSADASLHKEEKRGLQKEEATADSSRRKHVLHALIPEPDDYEVPWSSGWVYYHTQTPRACSPGRYYCVVYSSGKLCLYTCAKLDRLQMELCLLDDASSFVCSIQRGVNMSGPFVSIEIANILDELFFPDDVTCSLWHTMLTQINTAQNICNQQLRVLHTGTLSIQGSMDGHSRLRQCVMFGNRKLCFYDGRSFEGFIDLGTGKSKCRLVNFIVPGTHYHFAFKLVFSNNTGVSCGALSIDDRQRWRVAMETDQPASERLRKTITTSEISPIAWVHNLDTPLRPLHPGSIIRFSRHIDTRNHAITSSTSKTTLSIASPKAAIASGSPQGKARSPSLKPATPTIQAPSPKLHHNNPGSKGSRGSASSSRDVSPSATHSSIGSVISDTDSSSDDGGAPETVLHSGWLTRDPQGRKKGSSVRLFFVVFTSGAIRCYQKERDNSVKGVLLLFSRKVHHFDVDVAVPTRQDEHGFPFQIFVAGRTWSLRADSHAARARWIEVIKDLLLTHCSCDDCVAVTAQWVVHQHHLNSHA